MPYNPTRFVPTIDGVEVPQRVDKLLAAGEEAGGEQCGAADGWCVVLIDDVKGAYPLTQCV
jgi:hypothetical protein